MPLERIVIWLLFSRLEGTGWRVIPHESFKRNKQMRGEVWKNQEHVCVLFLFLFQTPGEARVDMKLNVDIHDQN